MCEEVTPLTPLELKPHIGKTISIQYNDGVFVSGRLVRVRKNSDHMVVTLGSKTNRHVYYLQFEQFDSGEYTIDLEPAVLPTKIGSLVWVLESTLGGVYDGKIYRISSEILDGWISLNEESFLSSDQILRFEEVTLPVRPELP